MPDASCIISARALVPETRCIQTCQGPNPPARARLRSSRQYPVQCMPKSEAGKDWSETRRSHALLALANDTRLNQAIDIGSREGEASCHPPAKSRGKKQHGPPIPILNSCT